MTYKQFKPTNIVHSVAFYEWTGDFDIFGVRDLLDEMILIIGRQADVITVCDADGCKVYTYRNFVKLNVLKKKKWYLLSYLWKREADDRSQFAIECRCCLGLGKSFEVHIDEAAVEHSKNTITTITTYLTEKLRPLYGIGNVMPYEYQPSSFSGGSVCDGTFTNDFPYKATTRQICGRSRLFKSVYLNRGTPSILQDHIRDIYEVNFLSQGHLDYPINGVTFRELVEKRKAGKLTQLNDVTWRWDIPGNDMENIRDDLIKAGMTIVTN